MRPCSILNNCAHAAITNSLDFESMNADVELLDKKVPIMQYTGLKDSQGKEVYEGDIVKVHEPDFLRCREVDVIEYRSAAFFIGDSDDMSSLHNAQRINTDMARVTVIGNLFENPDLLPQTK